MKLINFLGMMALTLIAIPFILGLAIMVIVFDVVRWLKRPSSCAHGVTGVTKYAEELLKTNAVSDELIDEIYKHYYNKL